MMSYLWYILSCTCCCLAFVFFILLIVGIMSMRKRGKKVTAKAAVMEGAEQVSRVFVRKSREEMLREEDEQEK
jgi:fumarate reductase subunit C